MHLVLLRLPNVINQNFTQTPELRMGFETTLSYEVMSYIGSPHAEARLAEARRKYSDESKLFLVQQALGPTWPSVNEIVNCDDMSAVMTALLWRYRESVSFDVFKRWFAMNTDHANYHPLLNAVLKEEHKLPFIKHLTDILAWHRVLFNVFKPGSISREEVRVCKVCCFTLC